MPEVTQGPSIVMLNEPSPMFGQLAENARALDLALVKMGESLAALWWLTHGPGWRRRACQRLVRETIAQRRAKGHIRVEVNPEPKTKEGQ